MAEEDVFCVLSPMKTFCSLCGSELSKWVGGGCNKNALYEFFQKFLVRCDTYSRLKSNMCVKSFSTSVLCHSLLALVLSFYLKYIMIILCTL